MAALDTVTVAAAAVVAAIAVVVGRIVGGNPEDLRLGILMGYTRVVAVVVAAAAASWWSTAGRRVWEEKVKIRR